MMIVVILIVVLIMIVVRNIVVRIVTQDPGLRALLRHPQAARGRDSIRCCVKPQAGLRV